MKILLLSNPNSVHTLKWAKSLADKGFIIYVLGLSDYDKAPYVDYPSITVHSFGFENSILKNRKDNLSKVQYLKALPKLKEIIRSFCPDILHAHYATSYGLLGSMSGFHPFILSVWGADVFDFPNKSFLHKKLLEFNFKKADKILSTSHVMAKEAQKNTHKPIDITPFGGERGHSLQLIKFDKVIKNY